MALTEIKVITGTLAKFNAAMATAIAAGFQPIGDVVVSGSQSYAVSVAKGTGFTITEAKVVNASSRSELFDKIESASTSGFTLDNASTSLDSGQCFAFVYKGSKGGTGAQGPAGPAGPKGDKGDTGATGPAGPKGDTGATGAAGAAGAKGDKGDKGDTGAPGATYTLPPAGAAIGGVKKGAAVADATEGTVLTQLNALLASLRAAGVIA